MFQLRSQLGFPLCQNSRPACYLIKPSVEVCKFLAFLVVTDVISCLGPRINLLLWRYLFSYLYADIMIIFKLIKLYLVHEWLDNNYVLLVVCCSPFLSCLYFVQMCTANLLYIRSQFAADRGVQFYLFIYFYCFTFRKKQTYF